MKNEVGVVSSTYAKYNTEELLDGISKAGFQYIELASFPAYFDHILPRPEDSTKEDVESTLALCKKYGHELYCIAGHTRMMKKDDVKDLKRVIDYVQMAGVHFLTTDTGEVSSDEDIKKVQYISGKL
jgi:sugar phosphate isomerase/epimerase